MNYSNNRNANIPVPDNWISDMLSTGLTREQIDALCINMTGPTLFRALGASPKLIEIWQGTYATTRGNIRSSGTSSSSIFSIGIDEQISNAGLGQEAGVVEERLFLYSLRFTPRDILEANNVAISIMQMQQEDEEERLQYQGDGVQVDDGCSGERSGGPATTGRRAKISMPSFSAE
jgi:hypothetical protein